MEKTDATIEEGQERRKLSDEEHKKETNPTATCVPDERRRNGERRKVGGQLGLIRHGK